MRQTGAFGKQSSGIAALVLTAREMLYKPMQILPYLGVAWLILFTFCLALSRCSARACYQSFNSEGCIVGAEAEAPASSAARTTSLSRRKLNSRETVFVVDDDAGILGIMEEVLASEGFVVHSFTDPKEALKAFSAQESKATLLVTDFCMNSMNGLELTEKLRLEQPDLKSILVSGITTDEALKKMPATADRFLRKPFALNRLVDTVNDTLIEASRSHRGEGVLAGPQPHLN